MFIEGNNQSSTNSENNEITKKDSIPEIQYKTSQIDVILKNSTLVPTLVKYISRNYTYGMFKYILIKVSLCNSKINSY